MLVNSRIFHSCIQLVFDVLSDNGFQIVSASLDDILLPIKSRLDVDISGK